MRVTFDWRRPQRQPDGKTEYVDITLAGVVKTWLVLPSQRDLGSPTFTDYTVVALVAVEDGTFEQVSLSLLHHDPSDPANMETHSGY